MLLKKTPVILGILLQTAEPYEAGAISHHRVRIARSICAAPMSLQRPADKNTVLLNGHTTIHLESSID